MNGSVNGFVKVKYVSFMVNKEHGSMLTLSDTGGEGGGGGLSASPPPPPYHLYRNKVFLIGLASWDLFYSHTTYFYTFWPNLDNLLAEGQEI